MGNKTLKPWQKIIIDYIEEHDDFVHTEEMMGNSDFERNTLSRIQIGFPKGEGHTFLSAYIACSYPSILIYKDMKHWKDICKYGQIEEDDINPDTFLVSAFEISHDIFSSSFEQSSHLKDLKKKFSNKKVVVIDNATEIIESFPRVVEWVFTVTEPKSAIVLLG